VRGAPLQMIVTEPTAPTLNRLVAHAARHLTLKQMGSGAFMIGGGWTAGLDERQKLSRALRSSVEGNLWVASRVVPALADLHAIRIWAGMNVNIDRAPILGEVPGLPGFTIASAPTANAGARAVATHRRNARWPLPKSAGRGLFRRSLQLKIEDRPGLPRGRVASGRSHL
jgi:glycine/D-amino acid oxidase-like deaminating enzyme